MLNSSLSLRPGSFAKGDNEHPLVSKSVGRIQKIESIRSALDAVARPIPYNHTIFFLVFTVMIPCTTLTKATNVRDWFGRKVGCRD